METVDLYFAACLAVLIMAGIFSLLRWIAYMKDVSLAHSITQEEWARAVDRMYEDMWTGDPADEVAAWERVIAHAEAFELPDPLITEARLRLLVRIHRGHNVRLPKKDGRSVEPDNLLETMINTQL